MFVARVHPSPQVVSRDNHATNGVVHVVDKVIVPAEGTIADVLSSDLHFGTFMSALEKTELASQLAEEGHFTVFAPTDSAFSKLSLEDREKVLGEGSCAGDIIRSHVLQEVSQQVEVMCIYSEGYSNLNIRKSLF